MVDIDQIIKCQLEVIQNNNFRASSKQGRSKSHYPLKKPKDKTPIDYFADPKNKELVQWKFIGF